jgi:hypothetical protein
VLPAERSTIGFVAVIFVFPDHRCHNRSISMFGNRLITTLTTCTLALVLTQGRAEAQVKPIKIKGGGTGTSGLPLPGQPPRAHWAVGEATHLGRYYGSGEVETYSSTPQPDGTIAGEFGAGAPFVFTGANGDQLVCWYGRTDHGASVPGTFVLTVLDVLPDGSLVVEAEFIAEFVPVPEACTGKFAGVTGSWIMYAFTEAFVLGASDPVDYTWEGEGTPTFPHWQ